MLHAKGYGGEIGNFNVELDEIMMQENNQGWDWLKMLQQELRLCVALGALLAHELMLMNATKYRLRAQEHTSISALMNGK